MPQSSSRKQNAKADANRSHTVPVESFLSSGTEMGEMFREFDGSSTSLGTIPKWPENLRIAVDIMLNPSFPMFIWRGKEELTNLYNDAYKAILGNKHSDALNDTWAEIWDDIGIFSDREGCCLYTHCPPAST